MLTDVLSSSRIRLQCKNTDTESNWIIVVCSWGSFDACLSLSNAKAQSLGKKRFEFSAVSSVKMLLNRRRHQKFLVSNGVKQKLVIF